MEPFSKNNPLFGEGLVSAYVLGWYDTKRKALCEPFPTERWNYEGIKKYSDVIVLLVQNLPQSREERTMLSKYLRNARHYNVRFILPPPISAYPPDIRVNIDNA